MRHDIQYTQLLSNLTNKGSPGRAYLFETDGETFLFYVDFQDTD